VLRAFTSQSTESQLPIQRNPARYILQEISPEIGNSWQTKSPLSSEFARRLSGFRFLHGRPIAWHGHLSRARYWPKSFRNDRTK